MKKIISEEKLLMKKSSISLIIMTDVDMDIMKETRVFVNDPVDDKNK